ncbi:MAG TPA: GNAT family N-acetyltransferase [Roseiflexaceae bacterium]|nr:GNAT family N-acetyltransferase [Roseiflexaceae bacterium]
MTSAPNEGMAQLPALAGVQFRLFRDASDYAALAALHTASMERDRTESQSLLTRPQQAAAIAGFAQWLGRPTERLLLAEVDRVVVGYQLIGEWMDERGRWQYLHRGLVHPNWRGNGLGTTMLRWAETKLAALAATHPTNGKAMFAAEAGASSDAAALLRAEGYQEAWRLAELICAGDSLPIPSLPSGLILKSARPEDHVALWRADNEVFGATGEWERHVPPRFEASHWLIAWDGSEIAGYCSLERRADVGAVAVLGVRAAWRKRGICRALLTRAIHRLAAQDVRSMRTIADADHGFPSLQLYKSLGFQVMRKHSWYQKPIGTDRFVFNWPRGDQIDIGGRHIHIIRAGTGSPTVIFDAGGDSDSLVWRHVLPRVAEFAHVMAFDRAGLGQSEPGPLPRTARDAADDLRSALAAAGVPGPYVLVGHSGGGINARLFASLHPADIAGIVLVDSPHEDMLEEWRNILPPDVWEQFVKHTSYEGGDYTASRSQIKAASPLPDVPLVVLTARQGDYPYGWPREALDAIRVRLQGQVVHLVSHGQQHVIEHTGHAIHQDRPEVVVEAIQSVITAHKQLSDRT